MWQKLVLKVLLKHPKIYSFFKNCSHFEILFSNPSEIIYLTWNIRYFGACNGVIACSVFADMWYEY